MTFIFLRGNGCLLGADQSAKVKFGLIVSTSSLSFSCNCALLSALGSCETTTWVPCYPGSLNSALHSTSFLCDASPLIQIIQAFYSYWNVPDLTLWNLLELATLVIVQLRITKTFLQCVWGSCYAWPQMLHLSIKV